VRCKFFFLKSNSVPKVKMLILDNTGVSEFKTLVKFRLGTDFLTPPELSGALVWGSPEKEVVVGGSYHALLAHLGPVKQKPYEYTDIPLSLVFCFQLHSSIIFFSINFMLGICMLWSSPSPPCSMSRSTLYCGP